MRQYVKCVLLLGTKKTKQKNDIKCDMIVALVLYQKKIAKEAKKIDILKLKMI